MLHAEHTEAPRVRRSPMCAHTMQQVEVATSALSPVPSGRIVKAYSLPFALTRPNTIAPRGGGGPAGTEGLSGRCATKYTLTAAVAKATTSRTAANRRPVRGHCRTIAGRGGCLTAAF